jgi:2-polyprenyl-3-methyl-5-hydroxy-6-metoxy-1,4-benzoquinol methylase
MHPAVILHERKASRWEELYTLPSFQRRAAVILGLLEGRLQPGASWLDAGCGSGFFSRQLASRGCAVTGLDASPGMIETSRKLAAAAGPFAILPQFELVTTIEHLPSDSGTFEGILCSSVIEYIDDPAKALREFARLLKPGGVLLMTVPNRASIVRRIESAMFWLTKKLINAHSKHHFSRQELEGLLVGAGFHVEAFDCFGIILPSCLTQLEYVGMLTAVRATRQ